MRFDEVFNKSEIILTEGALVTRLRAEYDVEFDPWINHAGLIYDNPEILETLYRQYVEIGYKHQMPIMVMTPTRRLNFETVKASRYSDKNVISDACSFLNKIKESYGDYAQNIMVGGLLGCKGDAYSAENPLDIEEAYHFHKQQTTRFKKEKVDYLFAGIMPEIKETIGMAQAMSETGVPYIISFMIRKDGCLIDGTPISDAMQIIDDHVNIKPVCYMTNCVHPTNLILALNQENNKGRTSLKRFKGVQVNASALGPEELNNCAVLQQDDFNHLIEEMVVLHKIFDFKIFGGCCGTNDKFINALSERLIKATDTSLNY